METQIKTIVETKSKILWQEIISLQKHNKIAIITIIKEQQMLAEQQELQVQEGDK